MFPIVKSLLPWILPLCLIGIPTSFATEEDKDAVSWNPDPYPFLSSADNHSFNQPLPGYGFRQLGHDAKYLFTRPFHMERKTKIKVTATAGAVLALYLLRDSIRNEAQEHRNEDRDEFLQGVRTMGKGGFAPSIALAAYLSSFATNNKREKETAFLLMESMGFTALFTAAGQFILASERPEDGDDIRFFRSGGHGISLDAALAASVVPPLRHQYLRVKPGDGKGRRFWKRTATSLLYTGAAFTAYQRVDQDKHWAPDAFLGMVTGLAVGEALCNSHDQTRGEGARMNFSVIPNGGVGLNFRLGRRRQL